MATHAAKKKPRIVTHPYLSGTPVDPHTLRDALKMFGTYALITLIYLLISALLVIDMPLLRILAGMVCLGLTWYLLFASGMGKGAEDVDHGERLYNRQEKGLAVDGKERRLCFHKLKGFLKALLGIIPFFASAVVLALTAEKVMTGLSALPSWVASYEKYTEVGKPLAYYHVSGSFTITAAARMITRLHLMPFVSMIGTRRADLLLTFERVSPILTLIAPVCYGLGYMRGTDVRTKVHTDIAAGNRKRRRKEQKKIRERRSARPESLN